MTRSLTFPETENEERQRNPPPRSSSPKSAPREPEDKPDPLDPRVLKDFRDLRELEERWDLPETVEQLDLQAPLDPQERTETLVVMVILDPKEFKDQRENADPQVFLASQE